ncbi:MAG: esterase-like activity of phytase family protein [Phocaeicola sp.]
MKRNQLIAPIATLFMASAVGCSSSQSEKVNYPTFASVAAETIYLAGNDTPIYWGGYGSSMVYHEVDSSFYLLTDRGPNVDGLTPESKVFPLLNYAPTIGQFRLVDDSLILVKTITLKNEAGQNLTGLPNSEGDGVSGEVAYTMDGEILTNPTLGLDSEGLAVAPDGTFWVSDEYAPFVMQFDPNGLLLQLFSPGNGLPDYYAKRRPNRGMEGLTLSKDGTRLYGIMQSPLYYPDKSTKDQSVNVRILEITLATGRSKEFIYQIDSPKNMVSEITFVNDSTLLVMERDSKFPKEGKGFKRVFSIDINGATDVSNLAIELLTHEELASQQIQPTKKTLFVDLLVAIPGYRHDKPEGITLIGDSILCVVNDDDFGIDATSDGKYEPKVDAEGNLDQNVVYFINLK